MSETTMDSGRDVVAFLTAQHQEIKGLLEQVATTTGDDRQEAFTELRRLLAVHETAEEEVVHPRARTEIANGEAVVGERLQEEHEAKEALAKLEAMDLGSAEFETAFAKFRHDVLAHAEAEEHQEFTQLAAELDESQLQRMRTAAAMAEKTAPTRPHAGVESKGANLAAGPFAAMLDLARDLITGKH